MYLHDRIFGEKGGRIVKEYALVHIKNDLAFPQKEAYTGSYTWYRKIHVTQVRS